VCLVWCQVVEYVGEIVGLRVADKREAEYHSGKRLQHQGACYLFRIDADQIIDATRKGGIARFVNHSCSVSILFHTIRCQLNLPRVKLIAELSF
jgi:SET domain-containing protein